jgi:type II secretory pathway pseudopilin PulG
MKSRTSRPGVTLVEMLVVLAILIMLVGVLATVWRRLDVQGKEKTLRNTFAVLDSALEEYRDARGGFPVPDPNCVTERDRNEFACKRLLDEPQSRVVMDRLDGRTLVRPQPPLPTLVYDPWTMPLDYTYGTGDTFPLLRSSGPDRVFGTPDDVSNR